VKLLFEKNYKIAKKQIFLSPDIEFVQERQLRPGFSWKKGKGGILKNGN
jgi:hypothetical protein